MTSSVVTASEFTELDAISFGILSGVPLTQLWKDQDDISPSGYEMVFTGVENAGSVFGAWCFAFNQRARAPPPSDARRRIFPRLDV